MPPSPRAGVAVAYSHFHHRNHGTSDHLLNVSPNHTSLGETVHVF